MAVVNDLLKFYQVNDLKWAFLGTIQIEAWNSPI